MQEAGVDERVASRSHLSELGSYFALAFIISWSLWLPLIASVQGWWNVEWPAWWHYTGAAGPISAAILVSARRRGRRGVFALLSQYSPQRASKAWMAFAVLCPLALLAIAIVVAWVVDGAWPTYDQLARTGNLPALGLPLTLAIHTLTFGVGEETGWRGFALPRLQYRWTALQSTHRLAILWGLWHLPAFFENESMMQMGPFEIVGWSGSLWMGAIFLTWLYNSSGGSLLVVVIWHGLFNQFSASEASGVVPAVMSIGVILIAMLALRFASPLDLRWRPALGASQRNT